VTQRDGLGQGGKGQAPSSHLTTEGFAGDKGGQD